MEKLKRFVPVIALALALMMGVCQPLQVFAAYIVFQFDDSMCTVEYGDGYEIRKYKFPTDGFGGESYYKANGSFSSTVTSKTGSIAVNYSGALDYAFLTFRACEFWRFAGGSDYDSYLFTDLISVSDFVEAYVVFDCYILSGQAVSGEIRFGVDTFTSSGSSTGYTLQTTQSFSLGANESKYFKISYPLSQWRTDDNEAAINPYVIVKTGAVSSGLNFTLSIRSFEFWVKIAESFPATPVISSNIKSDPVYYTLNDTPADLVVAQSYGDGEIGTITHQWYKSVSGSTTDGVPISGATSRIYTPSTSALGTSYYYCVVTNTYDDKVASATSPVACIKVVNEPTAPQITQNLSSGTMEYTQGDTASPFVISAINSGDGTLSYQWYKNTTNSTSGGTAISGATKSSYTPSTATVGTQYYYCVVTNSVGTFSESTTSNVGAIRVVPPPDPAQAPVINPNLSTSIKDYYIGDTAQELKIGASVTDGGTLTYQWYSNTINSSSGGTLLPGETDRTYKPPTDTLGTMYYYCVVTNTLPDSTATSKSNVACIRVKELPKASAPVISTNLPKDPIVYTEGDAAAAIGISARSPDGGVLTYQWYKNTVAENSGGTLIAGADGPSYEPDTSEVGTKYYYVVITNSLNDTTASTTSGVATVIVEQDKVPDLIGDVINGITNLPQAIMDGIVGLFVPDAEAIAAYQDQWSELLASRFGAVYESVQLLDEFASSIQMQDQQNTVPFPSVTLNLAGTDFTFGGWTVQVVPTGFENVIELLKRIISIICTLAFLNAMRAKFEGVLGGN